MAGYSYIDYLNGRIQPLLYLCTCIPDSLISPFTPFVKNLNFKRLIKTNFYTCKVKV